MVGSKSIGVEVLVLDANGKLCLDARNRVRFGIAGDGILVDNLGTPTGSRLIEVGNGRAQISLLMNGGSSVVSVGSEALTTVFLSVTD